MSSGIKVGYRDTPGNVKGCLIRISNATKNMKYMYMQNHDVVKTSVSLSFCLSVEHDNFGFSAGWFLDKVLLNS